MSAIEDQYSLEKNIIEGISAINSAVIDEIHAVLTNYASVLALDITSVYGYKLLYDDNAAELTSVYSALYKKNFNSAKELKETFDFACMMAVINHGSYLQLPDILKHYTNLLLLDLNGDYKALHPDDQVNVMKALSANYTYLQKSDVKAAFDMEVAKLKNKPTPEPIRSSGGGGGSGGGAISLPITPVVQDTTKDAVIFNDIDQVEWANQAIMYLYKRNIISGIGGSKFDPDANVTRAQFVKMVVLASGFPLNGKEMSFDDVPAGEWYYPYIAAAKNVGIVNGKSETLFGADDKITREQMTIMIYRTLKASGIELAPQNSQNFEDINDLDETVQTMIYSLKDAKIINGVGGAQFAPYETATRAQAAKIIFEMINTAKGVQ